MHAFDRFSEDKDKMGYKEFKHAYNELNSVSPSL
jgi:hypothetical protein